PENIIGIRVAPLAKLFETILGECAVAQLRDTLSTGPTTSHCSPGDPSINNHRSARAPLRAPTVLVGSPMRSGIIVEVIESVTPDFKAGDQVMNFHLGTWSEIVILNTATAQNLQGLPGDLAITQYPRSIRPRGLYRSLLCSYKSPTFVEDLKAATPDEVGVYFDNVGGHVLDAALTRMKNGTIAVCGAVSGYNSDEPMPINNWFEVISMRITIRGFIMLDYLDKAPMILQELIGAAGDGLIKLQDGETVVEARIEEQPEIWMRLFSGQNQGKFITKLTV
ncbi:putative Enoyl reductase (ER) domain-containing protein, partial [Seiridium unicorne]